MGSALTLTLKLVENNHTLGENNVILHGKFRKLKKKKRIGRCDHKWGNKC